MKNPNPAHTTDAMWDFIEKILALEPADFEFAGAYGLKEGYHSAVNDNRARWPGSYSIRLRLDLQGDFTKGRAFDITSRSAQRGDFRIMVKYGERIRRAARANDPRLSKWREILGQFDADKAPEAFDFQGHYERVPDSSHEWHFHWSILTAFVGDVEAYAEMYSVWIDQPLAAYQAHGLPTRGEDMGYFAKSSTGKYYQVLNLRSVEITRDDIDDVARLWAQVGIPLAIAPAGTPASGDKEWEKVGAVWVRLGWSAPLFGPPEFISPPAAPIAVDASAVAAALVADPAFRALLVGAAQEAEDT